MVYPIKYLKEGRMDTLSDYVIKYPYVKVQKPTADIEEKDVCLI